MTRNELIRLCRDARLRARLRQSDIAAISNVTGSAVSHFERDGFGSIDIFLGYVNSIPGLFLEITRTFEEVTYDRQTNT